MKKLMQFETLYHSLSKKNDSNMTPNELLLLCVATNTFANENNQKNLRSLELLKKFLQSQGNHMEQFDVVDQTLIKYDMAIYDWLSQYFLQLLLVAEGEVLREVASKLADKVPIVSLRFLSAWVALNTNEPFLCVEEADKVDQPFAALLTLQGQAYIELQEYDQAIESLKISAQLNPSEALTWFQLAKALYAKTSLQEALEALTSCEKITGSHIEILFFKAAILLDERFSWNQVVARKTFEQLMSIDVLSFDQAVEDYIKIIVNLCIALNDRKATELIFEKLSGMKTESHRSFGRILAKVSESYFKVGWYNEASKVLGVYSQPTVAIPPTNTKPSSSW